MVESKNIWLINCRIVLIIVFPLWVLFVFMENDNFKSFWEDVKTPFKKW